MLGFSAVVCFVVYFFVRQVNALLNLYKDASGMWHEDRFRPLAAAMSNLVLNLVLVQFIGIYGILISTVVAILCVGMPWLLHNLFTVIFERKYLVPYLKRLLQYTFIVLLSCMVTYGVCYFVSFESNVLTIALRALVCIIVPNIMYFAIYRKTSEFKQVLSLVNNMTRGKMYNVLYKLGM